MPLRVNGVTKEFDDVTAVDNVNLVADDDDFLVLLGPSGSGKTTTLRMIAGLETPTRGEIYIGDREVTSVEPMNRDIAMVFQNYALYPHMTVQENMSLGLKVSGVDTEEIENRVNDALEILGIEELRDRRPSELSGGQQQRVALGRSIVRDPSVFLMDEPLSNLDASLRTQMRKELKELKKRLGTTFVYVTHDQTEAMTMATKIAVLEGGRLQQVGSPEDLYDRPNNEFVAQFIGSPSMNFFDVERTSSDVLNLEGLRYELPSEMVDVLDNAQHDSLRLGIRPEDVQINTGGYEAEINIVEPIGSNVILYLELEGKELVVETDRGPAYESGELLTVDFPTESILLFGDGDRIPLGREVSIEAQS